MQIVVDAIDFFANCSDDVLDPDLAVEKLEEISFQMRHLSPKDLQRFIKFTESAAVSVAEIDPEKAAFYRSIPECLGLIEDSG